MCEARAIGAGSSAGGRGGRKRQRSGSAAAAVARRRRKRRRRVPCGGAAGVAAGAPSRCPSGRPRPLLDGRPLQLLSGPERIEAGWWDAGLAERDYFIAAGGRRRAGLDLPRAAAAIAQRQRGARAARAAGSCTAGLVDRGRTVAGRKLGSCLQRRSSPTSVKPRRRSESLEPAVAVDAAEQHVDARRSRAAPSSSAGGARGRVGAPL